MQQQMLVVMYSPYRQKPRDEACRLAQADQLCRYHSKEQLKEFFLEKVRDKIWYITYSQLFHSTIEDNSNRLFGQHQA